MNYLKITHNDIANGEGVRTVLWVAGCNHQCPGCHNQPTWDPGAGKPFDKEAMDIIIRDMQIKHQAGVTFSGGDPLFPSNRDTVADIAHYIKEHFPTKTVWLYTGYLWEEIKDLSLLQDVDVLVDGPFVQSLYDISLKWKGSTNQRVIDVAASRGTGSIRLKDV